MNVDSGNFSSDHDFYLAFLSIEKNFICAEVQSYEDLKEHGTEAAVKAAGKLRQQGRTCKSKPVPRYFSALLTNLSSYPSQTKFRMPTFASSSTTVNRTRFPSLHTPPYFSLTSPSPYTRA